MKSRKSGQGGGQGGTSIQRCGEAGHSLSAALLSLATKRPRGPGQCSFSAGLGQELGCSSKAAFLADLRHEGRKCHRGCFWCTAIPWPAP